MMGVDSPGHHICPIHHHSINPMASPNTACPRKKQIAYIHCPSSLILSLILLHHLPANSQDKRRKTSQSYHPHHPPAFLMRTTILHNKYIRQSQKKLNDRRNNNTNMHGITSFFSKTSDGINTKL